MINVPLNPNEMTALNPDHALRLALLGVLVGILSLHAWREGCRMARSPEDYRRMLIRKGSVHPLALLWIRPENRISIRSWGIGFSRVALLYAVFSFVVAGVLFALIVMDRSGMSSTVGPIAEFLSRFEAGLAC